jgi:ParB/RepB/Spo0J family partition protein
MIMKKNMKHGKAAALHNAAKQPNSGAANASAKMSQQANPGEPTDGSEEPTEVIVTSIEEYPGREDPAQAGQEQLDRFVPEPLEESLGLVDDLSTRDGLPPLSVEELTAEPALKQGAETIELVIQSDDHAFTAEESIESPIAPVTADSVHLSAETNIDEAIEAILNVKEFVQGKIPIHLIDFYPRNRKQLRQDALQELADNIARMGVIQDIILRPKSDGRYELVVGERRVRASLLAGLPDIPSKVYDLTNSEAKQIRASENAQREDLHPMEEALSIGEMLEDFPSIELIAKRLRKNAGQVENRVKLLSLVPEAQEVLLADVMSIREAQELAAFEGPVQQEFLDRHLKDWRELGTKSISDFRKAIDQLKCSLKNAPFDTEDISLKPEMGACSSCRFNSGCEQFLFAELASDPVCRKISCYRQKGDIQLVRNMTEAVGIYRPMAMVSAGVLDDDQRTLIKEIPGTEGLQFYLEKTVRQVYKPQMPEKKSFTDRKGKFNSKGYDDKTAEYNESVAYQDSAIAHRKIFTALLIDHKGRITPYMFTLDSKASETGQSGKVSLIQEDIKAGTATLSQLTDELSRVRENEETASKKAAGSLIDRVHGALDSMVETDVAKSVHNMMDRAARHWQMYEALDYSSKDDVEKALFPENWKKLPPQSMVDFFANLTDDQAAFLTRKRILAISDVKRPGSIGGALLMLLATNVGIDVAAFRTEVDEKEAERIKKFKKSESELMQLIKRKQKKRANKTGAEAVE